MHTILPIQHKRLWLIAMFIYYAAMRPIEILRLKFENVDLIKAKIYCNGEDSKNKKTQIIEIPDEFLEILKKKNNDYPKDWYIFSKLFKES